MMLALVMRMVSVVSYIISQIHLKKRTKERLFGK